MNSTSREEKHILEGGGDGVQTHKFIIHLRLCVGIYSEYFVDLQSLTCIDFFWD